MFKFKDQSNSHSSHFCVFILCIYLHKRFSNHDTLSSCLHVFLGHNNLILNLKQISLSLQDSKCKKKGCHLKKKVMFLILLPFLFFLILELLLQDAHSINSLSFSFVSPVLEQPRNKYLITWTVSFFPLTMVPWDVSSEMNKRNLYCFCPIPILLYIANNTTRIPPYRMTTSSTSMTSVKLNIHISPFVCLIVILLT